LKSIFCILAFFFLANRSSNISFNKFTSTIK
jgi:hypothetical protein